MPYLAPELFSGRCSYSQATDIYAFGMIEFWIGTFGEVDHDLQLALSIVKSLRPEITEDIPLFYRNLLEHPDPTK